MHHLAVVAVVPGSGTVRWSSINRLINAFFAHSSAHSEGLLDPLGGVGPWTFQKVQPTLQCSEREGGVGPYSGDMVAPALRDLRKVAESALERCNKVVTLS